jgi:hypothetical protein
VTPPTFPLIVPALAARLDIAIAAANIVKVRFILIFSQDCSSIHRA